MIECVPNFSEGRNPDTIAALLSAVRSVPGAMLLDHTSDADHNRTVLTFAGEAAPVAEAALQAIRTAVALIHLPAHEGVHPRIGAADVVPFVPLSGSTLDDCSALARSTGRRVWEELGVPAFLYEAAAADPARAPLEVLRGRAFSGAPDFGIARHPTAGAVILGARRFLIAWNINLHSQNLAAARNIARAIRQSSGGLHCVKSLGLELRSRNQVQVSVNLTDFEVTPLHVVFDRVREEAQARGIAIVGSELVGLIPQRALDLSRGHDLHWLIGDRIEDFALENRLQRALG